MTRGMPGFDGQGAHPAPDGPIPDVLGAVKGYRWWTLSAPPLWESPALAAGNWPPGLLRGMQAPWEPGENTATCRASGASGWGGHCHPPESIPDEECGCGFWAYWTLQPHDLGSAGLPVCGVVEGYGAVLTGEKGFRAAKARIVALHLPFTIMPETAARSLLLAGPQRQYGSHNPWWNHPKFTGKVIQAGNVSFDDAPAEVPPEPELTPDEEQAMADAAEAWMAVIGLRLEDMYPGVRIFETRAHLEAEFPPDLSSLPPETAARITRCPDCKLHHANRTAHKMHCPGRRRSG
jgi:hypothetical protein